MSKGKKTQTF